MRMRKVKWAVDYLNDANCLIEDPSALKGTWKERFDQKKIHVEIGCGKGNYSLNMAKLYPQEAFIAVEKNESAAGIAAKKFDDASQQENLVLWRNTIHMRATIFSSFAWMRKRLRMFLMRMK